MSSAAYRSRRRSRNISRTIRLTRFRTTALPTRELTVTPSREIDNQRSARRRSTACDDVARDAGASRTPPPPRPGGLWIPSEPGMARRYLTRAASAEWRRSGAAPLGSAPLITRPVGDAMRRETRVRPAVDCSADTSSSSGDAPQNHAPSGKSISRIAVPRVHPAVPIIRRPRENGPGRAWGDPDTAGSASSCTASRHQIFCRAAGPPRGQSEHLIGFASDTARAPGRGCSDIQFWRPRSCSAISSARYRVAADGAVRDRSPVMRSGGRQVRLPVERLRIGAQMDGKAADLGETPGDQAARCCARSRGHR